MNQLPPFPIDAGTLDLLWASLHPGPDDDRTSVGDFLTLMAEMGGSDTTAVADVVDDGCDGGAAIHVMRDQQYHTNDVLAALVEEIRRLRGEARPADDPLGRAIERLRGPWAPWLLIRHTRMADGGCACGWNVGGAPHSGHLADVLADYLTTFYQPSTLDITGETK